MFSQEEAVVSKVPRSASSDPRAVSFQVREGSIFEIQIEGPIATSGTRRANSLRFRQTRRAFERRLMNAASLQRVITRLAIKEPPENRRFRHWEGRVRFLFVVRGTLRAISPGDRRPIVTTLASRTFITLRSSLEISPLNICHVYQ